MVLFVNKSSSTSFVYLKTFFIAIILMITVSPLLSIMSKGDSNWFLFALILWTIGSSIIFYPFMEHIYPHMLTKMGFFLLTSILIIINTWFNMTLITFFLSYNYIYNTLMNTTLNQLFLFALLYVFLVSSLILKLNFSSHQR